MKKTTLLIIALAVVSGALQAQKRDRLAELPIECINPYVTHTSVAPDGSLWMVTECSEIFHANNIHSSWHIIKEGQLGSSGEEYENVTAFDRNTVVLSGLIWDGDIKRTSTGGRLWDQFNAPKSPKGFNWFHPAWRGEEGRMWIGSQDGMLAFSADSGRTFTALRDTAFDRKTGIDEIYMCSAQSGFIGCHDNSLYATTDNWRTYHRLPTPFDQKVITKNDIVGRVRQWKNYLIIEQGGESFYSPVKKICWKRTPVTLRYFEVDPTTGRLWGIDDSHQVVMTEDLQRWKPMGVNALFTIGIHDGHLYCRIEEGVMRVGANGVVDTCPFLTTERTIEEPKTTVSHGSRLWGYDEKSVYIKDKQGWYRVARPVDIAGLTPDPDRKDRVIVVKQEDEFGWREAGTFSIDLAGRMEPYTYRQPLAAFAKPGLASMEITTYITFGTHVRSETICYARNGKSLTQTTHTKTYENYDPHLDNGPTTETEALTDTVMLQLPAEVVEKALRRLGERYNDYPSPQDFGLEDTALDLHKVYTKRNTSSSNRYGYTITLVNRAGDTLTASGNTSAYCDLGSSTRFPWLLPMTVQWRGAMFTTHQPTLWQVLREAMPDSMFMKDYLDNSTLRPEEKLQSGDLLFVSSKWYESDMEQAIKASTGQYSHVALVEVDSLGMVWVIEATPRDCVKRKTFNRFESDNDIDMFGSFDIYRFSIPFDTAAVIARATALIGKPYDDAFMPDNDAYYCSELIQVAFGNLFPSQPMNWRDKDGNLPPYWIEHFKKLGVPVPEGVPGTNPTDLSRSPLLRKL